MGCQNTCIFQSCEVLGNSFFNKTINFQSYILCVPPVLRTWFAEQLRFMNSKYFLIVATQQAEDKRLEFYDQLQLFVEVALLIGYDKIYNCIFAKVQSFLLCVSE